jgi:hypothetical protein
MFIATEGIIKFWLFHVKNRSRWLFLYLYFLCRHFQLRLLFFYEWPFSTHSKWIVVHAVTWTWIPTTSIPSIIHFTIVCKLKFSLNFIVRMVALGFVAWSGCPHGWSTRWWFWHHWDCIRVIFCVVGRSIAWYWDRELWLRLFEQSWILINSCCNWVFQLQINVSSLSDFPIIRIFK